MAIIPENQFVGKITASSPEYPYGKAQDITSPGDGTGTPWLAVLVNDLFGFQQALLDAASIVPSGSPDQVGTSDYLDAINVLIAAAAGNPDSLYLASVQKVKAIAQGARLIGLDAVSSPPVAPDSPQTYMDFYSLGETTKIADLGFVNTSTFQFRSLVEGGSFLFFGKLTGGGNANLLTMDANNGVKLHHIVTEVARTTTAALGGWEVNNTLTGSGYERVLTESDKGAALAGVNNFNTFAYTLVLSDASKLLVQQLGTSPTGVTVPPNSSVAFPIGTKIVITSEATINTLSIAEGVGVTVDSLLGNTTVAVPHGRAVLEKKAADLWLLSGDLIA